MWAVWLRGEVARQIQKRYWQYDVERGEKLAGSTKHSRRIMNEVIRYILGVAVVVGVFFGGWAGYKSFERYQRLADERNQVQINDIQIAQTAQLVQVEKQKAQIKIVEAGGIAEAQRIINETLTDKYLQHEAIQAQEKMASSPNHTTIYIPSGQNGIPIVSTIDPSK
jgi:hypothetical protein